MESKKKIALVTGITGQDGSYMVDLLLAKGYEVHGIMRRSSSSNPKRISHLLGDPGVGSSKFVVHYGDLADGNSLTRILEQVDPEEVYNFGSQSHVRISFDIPESTADITGLGTLRLLEAIRSTRPHVRFYQASSSEMFGLTPPPQNERTAFHPRSPYAAAKAFAYWAAVNYRESYNMFVVNGILFNHESPRRGENFVTRKITRGIARILSGKQDKFYLGNLDAKRDWGYAPEYVAAAWRMLQQDTPDDYVIGTGEAYSVREFLEEAFRLAGMPDWQRHVGFDPRHVRPAEVPVLIADAAKAREKIGWQPTTRFKNIVRIMLEADCAEEGVALPVGPALHALPHQADSPLRRE